MSGFTIPLALKVAAGAFAAYNVVKGLKEGNLMQAVLGGVSAYFAFSGLGAMTATQAAAGQGAGGVVNQAAAINNTVGQGAASTAGTAAGAGTGVSSAMTEGFGAATSDLANSAFGQVSGTAADLAGAGADFGTTIANNSAGAAAGLDLVPMDAFQNGAALAMQSGGGDILAGNLVEAGSSGGFLDQALGGVDDIWNWAEANPDLASGIMQTGGGMLSGWAQARQQEEMYERQLKEEAARRRRMGAAVPASAINLKLA